MKIVTCTRPNASTLINGVKFSETPTGMVSEPVTDDVADAFCAVPGYTAEAVGEAPAKPDKPAKKAKE